MRTLTVLLLVIFPGLIFSQPKNDMPSMYEESVQTQNGKLFSVRIMPKEGFLKLFVTGYNVSNFSFDKTGVTIFVRKGDKLVPLFAKKEKDYYLLPKELTRPADLKIEIKHEDKSEKLQLRLK